VASRVRMEASILIRAWACPAEPVLTIRPKGAPHPEFPAIVGLHRICSSRYRSWRLQRVLRSPILSHSSLLSSQYFFSRCPSTRKVCLWIERLPPMYNLSLVGQSQAMSEWLQTSRSWIGASC
jgi:hypothetical protein